MRPAKNLSSNEDLPDLPANKFAEELILGAIVKSGDPEMYSQVAEILTTDSFTVETHRRIFEAMGDLYLSGAAISYSTIALNLQKKEKLTSLSQILDAIPSDIPNIVNLENYIAEV